MSPVDAIRPCLFILALVGLGWSMRQAAGRLAPRVAIGTIIFLVSRWPVLVGWIVGTAGTLALLLHDAAQHGRDLSGDWFTLSVLSAFCGLGFATLSVSLVFLPLRALSPKVAFPLEDGEAVLAARPANHFLQGEGRGGKLLVTTRRIGFCPHRFNVQRVPWSVPLDQIRSTAVEGDRFLLVAAGNAPPAWIATYSPQRVAAYIEAFARLPEAERATAKEEILRVPGPQ